jgi:hypothetical protein
MKSKIICLIIIQVFLIHIGMLETYTGQLFIGQLIILIAVLGIVINVNNLIENY